MIQRSDAKVSKMAAKITRKRSAGSRGNTKAPRFCEYAPRTALISCSLSPTCRYSAIGVVPSDFAKARMLSASAPPD